MVNGQLFKGNTLRFSLLACLFINLLAFKPKALRKFSAGPVNEAWGTSMLVHKVRVMEFAEMARLISLIRGKKNNYLHG